MKTLLLNDSVAAIDDSLNIAFTMNVIDIGNITSRSSDTAKEIVLKSNPINDAILDNAKTVNSAGRVQYKLLKVTVLDSGYELIRNGVGYITQFDVNYKLQVFSGIADFFEVIKDLNVGDLDFGQTLYEWQHGANYADSHKTKGSNDVFAAFIKNGQTFPASGGNIKPGVCPPAFSYDKLIEKIIDSAGFVKDGIIFSNDLYSQLFIPYSRDTISYGGKFISDRAWSAEKTTAQVMGGAGGSVSWDNTTSKTMNPDYYDFAHSVFDPKGSFPYNPNPDPRKFKTDVYVKFIATVTGGGNSEINIDYGSIATVTVSGPLTAGQHTIYKKFKDIDVDYIRFEVLNTGGASISIASGEVIITPKNLCLDTTYSFRKAEVLPDVTQTDIITDFIIRFALLIKSDGRKISFKSIQDVINDRQNAIDWTNKRDTTGLPVIDYVPTGYYRINNFKYSSSDDAFNADIDGIGTIEVDNEQLGKEGDYFSSGFSGSLSGDVVAPDTSIRQTANIPIWNTPPANYSKAADTSPGLRILYRLDGDVKINGYDRGLFFPDLDPASNYNDLSFSQILSDYYSGIAKALQSYKQVTQFYYLASQDLYELDPFKLIYDSGDYYILTTIIDYVVGSRNKSTKVVLFKVS